MLSKHEKLNCKQQNFEADFQKKACQEFYVCVQKASATANLIQDRISLKTYPHCNEGLDARERQNCPNSKSTKAL